MRKILQNLYNLMNLFDQLIVFFPVLLNYRLDWSNKKKVKLTQLEKNVIEYFNWKYYSVRHAVMLKIEV